MKTRTEKLKELFHQGADRNREPLTHTEHNVYEFLYRFTAEKSFQPSIREIGLFIGATNTASVVNILKSLHEKGYIRRDSANARALTLQ